jgi:hypothetical protein
MKMMLVILSGIIVLLASGLLYSVIWFAEQEYLVIKQIIASIDVIQDRETNHDARISALRESVSECVKKP